VPTMGDVPPHVEGENAALALRQRLDLGDAPINVWELIRDLGVLVWRHDFGPEFGDGMYIRKGGRSLIIVNSARRPSRQRFTAAHELGHHELHRHGQDNLLIGDVDVVSTGKVPAEKAANAFAANLMAPTRAVVAKLGDLRGNKIKPVHVAQLMGRFGLSYEATCWRLRSVGVVSKTHVESLLAEPSVEQLLAAAGIDEEANFPPGPALPAEFVANVDKLWQHHAIDDYRYAQMLRTDERGVQAERDQRGVERKELPDIDEAAAAALLDE
jgi:Zn-dependent peptidase ImmA (M78 family)